MIESKHILMRCLGVNCLDIAVLQPIDYAMACDKAEKLSIEYPDNTIVLYFGYVTEPVVWENGAELVEN